MLIKKNYLLAVKCVFLSLLMGFIVPAELNAGDDPKAAAGAGESPDSNINLRADEIARQALQESLYYRHEQWFSEFKRRIGRLESTPKNVETLLELMKCHFYFSALHVDHSHVLAVTREYKIPELADVIVVHLREAKNLARQILKNPETNRPQKAEAYLYLGGSEGYLGIFEFDRGNFLTALLNGLQADNHLEEALRLNPARVEAHLGLGTYRYTNSRLGGLGNLILQTGKDLRWAGIQHLEKAVNEEALGIPLALKTVIWFYISEQINPRNFNLPPDHPLSPSRTRRQSAHWIRELEKRYFSPPDVSLFQNKELAMMKAIQYVLDENYAEAKVQFNRIIEVTRQLEEKKGYKINPQQVKAAYAGARFSEVMLMPEMKENQNPHGKSICLNVNQQITFLDGGGKMVDYYVQLIQEEIDAVFYDRLQTLSRQYRC